MNMSRQANSSASSSPVDRSAHEFSLRVARERRPIESAQCSQCEEVRPISLKSKYPYVVVLCDECRLVLKRGVQPRTKDISKLMSTRSGTRSLPGP